VIQTGEVEMSVNERVDRTSPEPDTLLARVLGFALSGEHGSLTCWRRPLVQFFNPISRARIDP
jgi:hypothetical protein